MVHKKFLCIVILVFLSIGLMISQQTNAAVCNVPTDRPTIQAAINDPTCDPINVAAGSYNENIVINRALTLQGAGRDSTFINGVNSGSNVSVVKITASGNVTLSGFTITNAPVTNPGDLRFGILTNSPVSGVTYTIVNNKVVGTNNPDAYEDYGIYGQNGGKENLVITNNIVTQTGANNIVVETHQGTTDISYNTLDAGCYGADAIFVMTHSGMDVSNLQKANYNTIDMGTGGPFDYDHKATGISFNAVNGTYGVLPAKFLANSIEVIGNKIFNLKSHRRGIGFWNDASSGPDGNIISPLVSNNTISGAPGDVTESMGIDTVGLVTDAIITNNTITGVDYSFKERTWKNHIASGTQLNFNSFSNNSRGVVTERSTGTLNAENNWWGCYGGPGHIGCDPVSSNVDYDPWLQIYWKDYNGPENPGGYMPDIDQNQDFDKKAIALDFDDDDAGIETEPGFTSFTILPYSQGGYGWDSQCVQNIDDRKRISGTLLGRDLHFDNQDCTFKIDLPNGTYNVTLYMGDMQYSHDNMDVSAEGVLVLDNISTTAGEVEELSFSTTVSDGTLDILFHDDGGTDPNWVVNGLKIMGIEKEYCAPVAEANSLWWLDKAHGLGIFENPEVGEGYIGGDINQDGSSDILDLVQDLAILMKTNQGHTGTTVEDQQAGIDTFLEQYNLTDKLYEHTEYDDQYLTCQEYFAYLEDEVKRSQDVKLDLGFWHVEEVIFNGGEPPTWTVVWKRMGGHAVTVAGVDSENNLFAISDPDKDAAEAGVNPGFVRTPIGVTHPNPHEPALHNNENYASHDIYTVAPSQSPGGKCGLLNYPFKWNFPEQEQVVVPVIYNEPPEVYPCQTFTEIEAAVIVSPIVCGNGVVDLGEECDDGNTNNGDGCSSTCEWEPDIAIDPTSWDFGDVTVFDTATQTFTISNTDENGKLTIGTISITGSDASQFSKQNDNCSGQTILPTGTCTVEVKFSPTTLGSKSATLTIPSNDPDENPLNVSLSGNSVAPAVTCSFIPDGTILIRGGTLKFWASVKNDDDASQTFQFATNVKLPSGNMYPLSGYLVGPVEITLSAGESKSKQLSQVIPMNAPYGTYTYYGYVGKPGVGLYHQCQFTFQVVP